MYQPKLIQAILFLLILFSASAACANSVDELKSDDDVYRFLMKTDKVFMQKQGLTRQSLSTDSLMKKTDCGGIVKQWDIKAWEKADFNGDGKIDLFITLFWAERGNALVLVTDNGNNTFKSTLVDMAYFRECKLAKPIKINGKQLLLFYKEDQIWDRGTSKYNEVAKIDTLIYRDGEFIEFNAKPASVLVKSIHVETTMCFGTCPMFKLDIAADGTATYTAEKYNPETGVFKGKIDADKLKEILLLINYIDIKKLDDEYAVNWTDMQTISLKVKFKDGSVKEISDYGLQGTRGLTHLYKLLSRLRASQTWYE